MADNQEHIKPTAELIRQYLEGTLDDKTMHALEKQALNDPFLAEALEGFAMHRPDQRPALRDLRARLEERVAEKPRIRRLDYRWLAAAAVLLFISITALFIMNPPLQRDIAQVKEPQQRDSAAAATVPAGEEALQPAADEAVSPETVKPADAPSQAQTPQPPATAKEQAANARQQAARAKEQVITLSDGKSTTAKEIADNRSVPSAAKATADAVPPVLMKKALPQAAAPPALKMEQADAAMAYTEKIDTIRIGKYAADTTTYALQSPADRVEGKITGAPNKYPNYHTERDERIISGVVVDAETGRRLAGVTVNEAGSAKGAVTDTSGNFALKVDPRNNVKLDFSMLGYEKTNVEVAANKPGELNVKLPVSSNQALNETVVVGYGKPKTYGETTGKESSRVMIRGISTAARPGIKPVPSVSSSSYSSYLNSRKKLVIPGLLENKTGQVRLSFTVMPNATLKNFKVLESMGDIANKAAIRIVKEGPAWLPADSGKKATAEVVVPLQLLKQE